MAKRERTVVAVFAPGATIPKGWQQLKGADVAKRKTMTDAERATARAWDWNRPMHKTLPWQKLSRKQQDFVREVVWMDAELIGIGIAMGRALATPGGNPGKGKGGGR